MILILFLLIVLSLGIHFSIFDIKLTPKNIGKVYNKMKWEGTVLTAVVFCITSLALASTLGSSGNVALIDIILLVIKSGVFFSTWMAALHLVLLIKKRPTNS